MKLGIKIFFSILIFSFSLSCVFANDIRISQNDGIYHITLKGEKVKKRIKFISSETLITNKEAHEKSKAILTVNAGFFDPHSGKTISYIVTDRITSADPMLNPALLTNPFIRQNLNKIINRSEFRVMRCGNNYKYAITQHNDVVPFDCSIETSAQGGPLILPELQLEKEAFIVKDSTGKVVRESASVLHKTSRTIIGLKGNDECHILIITDEHPMDMYDVQKLCKDLGFDRAMAFDGGSSTSMNYKNTYSVISIKGDGAGRMLKSFMLVY